MKKLRKVRSTRMDTVEAYCNCGCVCNQCTCMCNPNLETVRNSTASTAFQAAATVNQSRRNNMIRVMAEGGKSHCKAKM